MKVAVVSLCPLAGPGGSERFTLDAIQSIRAGGHRVQAFAVRDTEASWATPGSSQAPQFVHTYDAHERELLFEEVLSLLARFDAIWIHQFLASDLVFDILAAAGEKPVLLTSLGNTRQESRFRRQYRPARNHHFVHPCKMLAPDIPGPETGELIPAGIWADAFGFTMPVEREPLQICTVGGVSPGCAPETAILALPERCSLVVAGTPESDAEYLRYIGSIIPNRKVYFTGEVPEARRRAVIGGSGVLIVPNAPIRYDGKPSHPDPFSCTVVLEALGCDTLPLVSDAAQHVEVMRLLGLEDFVYPARDHEALRRLIEHALAEPVERMAARKARARAEVRRSFLWDDYWCRVRRALRLETPRSAAASASGLRSAVHGSGASATGYSVGAHTLNWKAFRV